MEPYKTAIDKYSYSIRSAGGFTLIELSIVLVIIGLIVGGVLVGKDLIDAAAIRAQVSQIEKYQTAVHTFEAKFNVLPGDMDNENATQTGMFTPRGWFPGQGDGNGLIDGIASDNSPGPTCGYCEQGETAMFWVDLSTAQLIDGYFNTAVPNGLATSPITTTSTPSLYDYFPKAQIGQGNFVTVYAMNSTNYYEVSAIISLGDSALVTANPGLTASQAYAMDIKIDDGFPQTGNVQAMYLNSLPTWVAGGGTDGVAPGEAASPSATTCYDNADNASNPMQYSLSQNSGNGLNCALSFRFQ